MAFRSEIADFGAFYERTYHSAYRTALGILHDHALAADVTQEAYASAYSARRRFRGDSPGIAWLHRIVVNAAIASLRRRRVAVREIRVLDGGRRDDTLLSADRLTILDALGRLAPRQRAAVILRYYHDYDYATIAEVLSTTPNSVGVMLSRALDALRTTLEAPGAEPETAGATR